MPYPVLPPIKATPAANSLVKADNTGKIASGWLPDLSGVYAALNHTHTVSALTDWATALASPPAIGGTTPAAITGTTGTFRTGLSYIRVTDNDANIALGGSVHQAQIIQRASGSNQFNIQLVNNQNFVVKGYPSANAWIYANANYTGFGVNNPAYRFHTGTYDLFSSSVSTLFAIDKSAPTPANGIGVGMLLRVYSSAATYREVGAIEASFTEVTDASRASEMNFYTWNVGTKTKSLTLIPAGIRIGSAQAFYFGAEGTDGSWRIIRSGDDLKIQRRVSSSWVDKSTIAA